MQLYCQNSFAFVFKQLITIRVAGSFPLHHFFLLLLLEFCFPPPNHHHHIFNGFQAITVSPKVEKENSRWDAAPVEKFNKMWKPSTLFQPPFRESICDRKRAHARVQKHPRYSPQSWVKNFLFLTHMHTHTQTHQVGNWVQMGIFHNGWAQLTKWLTGWLHEAWLPVRHKLEECKESLHSPGASSLKYTHTRAQISGTLMYRIAAIWLKVQFDKSLVSLPEQIKTIHCLCCFNHNHRISLLLTNSDKAK